MVEMAVQVVVAVVMTRELLQRLVLVTRHQHLHHKEMTAVVVATRAEVIMVVVAEVLAKLETAVNLETVMAVMELHHPYPVLP